MGAGRGAFGAGQRSRIRRNPLSGLDGFFRADPLHLPKGARGLPIQYPAGSRRHAVG